MHYELVNSSLVPWSKSKIAFVPLFFCLKNTVLLFKKIKPLLARET